MKRITRRPAGVCTNKPIAHAITITKETLKIKTKPFDKLFVTRDIAVTVTRQSINKYSMYYKTIVFQ